MEDRQIVDLFIQRNEDAIKESKEKYGGYCARIAGNILSVSEDIEECVSDTWISAWKKIPPVIPVSLKAFYGKLVRDISLSKYRANHAKKRYNGLELIMDELSECIPSGQDVQNTLEQHELSDMLNLWLGGLPADDRVLFIKRYYYGETVKSLAQITECTENQMAQKMLRLRKSLKSYLKSGGVTL